MAVRETGGAAFPQPLVRTSDGSIVSAVSQDSRDDQGMDLRDWFAGQSLHEAADAICDDLSEKGDEGAREHAARHAKAAYLLSDAMIAEREKGGF